MSGEKLLCLVKGGIIKNNRMKLGKGKFRLKSKEKEKCFENELHY